MAERIKIVLDYDPMSGWVYKPESEDMLFYDGGLKDFELREDVDYWSTEAERKRPGDREANAGQAMPGPIIGIDRAAGRDQTVIALVGKGLSVAEILALHEKQLI